MPAADPTTIHTAVEFCGSLLYGLTAMIIVFGLLVVGLSFRRGQEKD